MAWFVAIHVPPYLYLSFFFWLFKAPRKEILPAESTFISLVSSFDTLPLLSDEDYLLLLSFIFKASCLVCRKCNMNCWWYIHHNCSRRSILDVVLCWEMIRYFSLNLVLGNIPLFLFWKFFFFGFFVFLLFCYIINALSILFTLLLKVDDLSRMYRLYHKISKGLDPVSNIFKQVSCFLLTFIFITTRTCRCSFVYTLVLILFWCFPCCSMLLLKVQPWCNRPRMLQVVRFILFPLSAVLWSYFIKIFLFSYKRNCVSWHNGLQVLYSFYYLLILQIAWCTCWRIFLGLIFVLNRG